ncbi:MAG TPA: helix-turn-helix domain-containing protein [Actinomycetes bacterium]|nr:helix-turn-helix domain-containing protein [Actinomycetes bacterium]
MRTTSRRKRLPRAAQVEQNRAAVLAAAGRVFREFGYTRASLDAIAEEAGFSKGVIYSQFASKADLFITLLEQRIEERAGAQLAAVSAFAAAGEAEAFFEYLHTVTRADPQWRLAVLEFRVAAARNPELNARYARAHQRTIDGLAQSLRTLLDARGVEPDFPVPLLAAAGLGFETGVLLEDIAIPDAIPQAQATALIGRLFSVAVPNPPEQT